MQEVATTIYFLGVVHDEKDVEYGDNYRDMLDKTDPNIQMIEIFLYQLIQTIEKYYKKKSKYMNCLIRTQFVNHDIGCYECIFRAFEKYKITISKIYKEGDLYYFIFLLEKKKVKRKGYVIFHRNELFSLDNTDNTEYIFYVEKDLKKMDVRKTDIPSQNHKKIIEHLRTIKLHKRKIDIKSMIHKYHVPLPSSK